MDPEELSAHQNVKQTIWKLKATRLVEEIMQRILLWLTWVGKKKMKNRI